MMNNNPEHNEKIYEKAINYMNKAQEVSLNRITCGSFLCSTFYINCQPEIQFSLMFFF